MVTVMANELHYQKMHVLFYNVIEQTPPILANYSLASQILECLKNILTWVGIILDQKMTFNSHINHIVSI